jgi:hypothetical protein
MGGTEARDFGVGDVLDGVGAAMERVSVSSLRELYQGRFYCSPAGIFRECGVIVVNSTCP